MRLRLPAACALAAVLVATTSPARAQRSAPADAPPKVHQTRDGFLITGAVVFGVVYGLTLFGSALAYSGAPDPEHPCSYCKQQALLFAIPVAGPLLSETAQPSGTGHSYKLDAIWGGLQAAGLAMIIIGAIGHDVPQQPLPATGTRVSLVPLVTPQGGAVSFRLRW